MNESKSLRRKGHASDWVSSRAKLAEALGCHPTTISIWLRDFAGDPELPTEANGGRCPTRGWNLPAWRKFSDGRHLLNGKAPAGGQAQLDFDSLSAIRRAREEMRLKRESLDFEREQGKSFTREEVATWLSDKGARLVALIHQRLSLEAPMKLAGLSASEIADRMGPIEKELIEAFRKPMA